MITGKSIKHGLFALILLLLFTIPSPADTTRVVLYPSSAFVTENTRVRLIPDAGRLKKAVFTLPAAADPQTLTIAAVGNPALILADQQYRKVDPDGVAINDERSRKLAKLKEERAALTASLRSAEAQIQFWQSQTKTKSKTPQDATNLAATIARNTKKAWQEKAALEVRLEDNERKNKDLQEAMQQSDGRRRVSWEVTAWFRGPDVKEAAIGYSYVLADCGWQPLFRFNALPAENTVVVGREAEIRQNSGRDWHGIELVLADGKAIHTAAPAELTPWRIGPSGPDGKTAKAKTRSKKKSVRKTDSGENPADRPPAAPLPALTAGTHSLASGVKGRIVLQEERLPAAFVYVARPRESNQAYLIASLSPPSGPPAAGGNAAFMIDGTLTGNRPFAASGREDTVLFGADPRVAVATAVLPINLTGDHAEKKNASDRKTTMWRKRIDVHNGSPAAVKLKIEEPLPLAGDDRIRVTLAFLPEPSERTPTSVFWLSDLPAGGKTIVTIDITVESPPGMKLDMGW